MPAFEWNGSAYTKTCVRCRVEYVGAEDQSAAEKTLSQYFWSDPRTVDGFSVECRDCNNGRRKGYRLKIPKAEMLAAQGGKCALCSVPLSLFGTSGAKAQVDHDHETNEVRGLLCTKCNTGMYFIDNEDWLDGAIAYRDFHRS